MNFNNNLIWVAHKLNKENSKMGVRSDFIKYTRESAPSLDSLKNSVLTSENNVQAGGIRRNTQLLTDGGEATSYTALTAGQSGLITLVPALTGGLHDITLPSCADAVGCTYTFVLIATAGQDFDVLGAASEKILGAVPKGDGDNVGVSDANDSVGFDANAVIGSRFSVTCISATAGTAWIAHDILDGLAANTGGINLK